MKSHSDETVSQDFLHLSQTIASSSAPIPYELVVILEKCRDLSYKQLAEENLIAYSNTNDKVSIGLNNISHSEDENLKNIRSIAQEFLDKAKLQTLARPQERRR